MNIQLQPGDIGAVRGRGISGWCSQHLFSPETDRFHYFLLWMPTGDDWIILESISKGVAVGRLSFYQGEDVKFYRVNCPQDLRGKAPIALTQWGRARYDYWLILKLVASSLFAWTKILFKEHRFRRLRAEDLTFIYSWDDRLICTEAIWLGFNSVGVGIVPWGVPSLPCSFRQAELDTVILLHL